MEEKQRERKRERLHYSTLSRYALFVHNISSVRFDWHFDLCFFFLFSGPKRFDYTHTERVWVRERASGRAVCRTSTLEQFMHNRNQTAAYTWYLIFTIGCLSANKQALHIHTHKRARTHKSQLKWQSAVDKKTPSVKCQLKANATIKIPYIYKIHSFIFDVCVCVFELVSERHSSFARSLFVYSTDHCHIAVE